MPEILPSPGQRWVSDTEPELGLGIILKAEFGKVEVFFPAANEQRLYALKASALRRVRFSEGDHIKLHDGAPLTVDSVKDAGKALVYVCGGREVNEAELSDLISFSTPAERLMAGQVDDLYAFDLRAEALRQQSRIRHSPARGFAGGRIDLIPHQISIASDVASRLTPRVLLADEVGLGKTIEACLIMHRLHLTGRANRILILLPEALVHQWFVELFRRFNLLFSIFDEERCGAIESNSSEGNPFLDSQTVLCDVMFLAGNPARAAQAVAAGWDLLIVDEAHHLEWSAAAPSPQYAVVDALAKQASGVLLLTATPQQLGPEGHFARLRLLDPDRYSSLDLFLKESEQYERTAKALERVIDGKPLRPADQKLFAEHSPRIRASCEALLAGKEEARQRLVSELIDSFGTGRVLFRNMRTALTGFPERKAILVPLSGDGEEQPMRAKVKWLVGLLKKLRDEKILLICHSREVAETLLLQVQQEINVPAGVFHEGLTLLQRDRNAAWFAEPEGARILFCSEIGSEGRNFQFAHHLALFDLPADPEVLEQRIGRLDRIGQTATIRIYVPYIKGSQSEVLAKLYQEGLDAFEQNLHGASEMAAALKPILRSADPAPLLADLDKHLASARALRAEITGRLKRGHDRLLAMASCRPERAEKIIAEIRAADSDASFEPFVIRLLDRFGVQCDDLAPRTYLLAPGHLLVDALPGLPAEGMSVTFDRARALSREDLGFLTLDHPLVRGSLDLLLGTETGNSAFGLWIDPAGEAIFLELYAVVEALAPAALHVHRFLPPTPIRIVVDHALVDRSSSSELASLPLKKGDIFRLLDRGAIRKKALPAMLEKANALAEAEMKRFVAEASQNLDSQLGGELSRLEELREINDHVLPEEIAVLRKHWTDLEAAIHAARLRVDALRLIFRTSAEPET